MIYEFSCSKCNEEFEVMCSLANRTKKHPCPACNSKATEQTIRTAPSIGDPIRMGLKKIDPGFREVLQRIKRTNPGSNMHID